MLLQDSPIVDVVASILGTEQLWLFFEQVWLKSGGRSQRTPWHQDATSWITNGEHVCGFWITFERMAADESLEFVRAATAGPSRRHRLRPRRRDQAVLPRVGVASPA